MILKKNLRGKGAGHQDPLDPLVVSDAVSTHQKQSSTADPGLILREANPLRPSINQITGAEPNNLSLNLNRDYLRQRHSIYKLMLSSQGHRKPVGCGLCS